MKKQPKKQPMKGVAYEVDKARWPMDASIKYDGVRAICDRKQVRTKSWELLPNEYIQHVLGKSEYSGLDGELIVGDPAAELCYSTTESAVMRVKGEPNFTYYVFDFVNPDLPFWMRQAELREHARHLPHVVVVEQVRVETDAELQRYYQKVLAEGHEGVMARTPDSLYKYGRSTALEGNLWKLKHWDTSEARVLSKFEGFTNTNPMVKDELGFAKRSMAQEGLVPNGTLGGWEVEDIHHGWRFRLSTGPGLTAEVRAAYWARDCTGMLVKYRFQRKGMKDAPRIAGFLGEVHPSDL